MAREDYLKQRADEKRSATLQAARARFAADGLDGASMESIAHDAAISTATLYRYFPSKLSLFEAVLKDGVAAFEHALSGFADRRPQARLEAISTAYAEMLDDPLNAGMVRAVFSATPRSPQVARLFYDHVKSVVAGAFHAAVGAAHHEGVLRQDLDLTKPGGHLMGMIEHATLWRRLLTNEAGEDSPARIAEAALAAFWAAYGKKD